MKRHLSSISNQSIKSILKSSSSCIGKHVTVHGWVTSIRKSKNIVFIHLNDGQTFQDLQIVSQSTNPKLSIGTSISVSGKMCTSFGKGQSIELEADEIKVHGQSIKPLINAVHPTHLKSHLPHLAPRTKYTSTLLRFRSALSSIVMNYFSSRDYVKIDTPILTCSDAEGAGEQFQIANSKEWFNKDKVSLTVSSQLHLEACMMGLSQVWSQTPIFRADKSDTSRHLAEFWMIEAETAFINDLNTLMNLVEDFLRNVVQQASAAGWLAELHLVSPENTNTITQRWKMLDKIGPWNRMTYKDAIQSLEHITFKYRRATWDTGLTAEHEKHLAKQGPIFITDYPTVSKPFYMLPSTPTTASCFDLLVPDMGELAGGSLREHDRQALIHSMESKQISTADLQWYIDLRTWGTVPHGGFGMRFDRLVAWLGGVDFVRNVLPFPRWTRHIKS